jgi:hypothetical protein
LYLEPSLGLGYLPSLDLYIEEFEGRASLVYV